jgi:hypothetical protein
MSALSDLQKKLEKEAQGIMFPFSAKAPTVDTKQEVYNSATDGIMTMQGQKYVGPDAVIQYGSEKEGFARQLKQIEAPMLPQFDETQFPKAGEGIVQTPTPPIGRPVEPEQPTQPDQPAFDPCPPGFKYDPQLQRCVPIQQESSDKRDNIIPDGRRNIGDTAQALGQVFNRKILEDQGITQDGTYQDDVTYTIDNNIPWLSLIPVIGTPLNIFQKNKADKQLQTLNDLDGVSVTQDKDGKNIVKVDNEKGKLSVQRALTNESLKGNIASTQKTNPDGSLMRDEFGRVQIAGPVTFTTYGKSDGMGPKTKPLTEAEVKERQKQIREDNLKTPTPTSDTVVRPGFGELDTISGQLDTGTVPIRQTGGDASVMEEVQRRQASTTTTAPTIGSQAASGADAQKSLMTPIKQTGGDASAAEEVRNRQQTQENKNRQERKREEKRQKDKLGYGQNIDQSIIDANKKDSDREAQKQTGDPTMRAVTDRYGNPVRDRNGKVVTNPAPKSGGGGGGSGGGSGGGKSKSIVCTAMYQSTGLQDWAKAMRIWYIYQKRYLTIQHQEGYHKLFKPFVKGMHKNKSIKALGSHVAKHRTQHLKHIMFNSKPSLLGKIYSNILEPVCYITGVIKTWKKK